MTFWIFFDNIVVWAPSILHFKGLGLRNLQYEMRICKKSHNKVTKAVYVWFEFLWIRRYVVHIKTFYVAFTVKIWSKYSGALGLNLEIFLYLDVFDGCGFWLLIPIWPNVLGLLIPICALQRTVRTGQKDTVFWTNYNFFEKK